MSQIVQTSDLNRLLREFSSVSLSGSQPTPPVNAQNVSWATDAFGNVAASVPVSYKYDVLNTYGDSITQGVGSTQPTSSYVSIAPANCYVALLAAALSTVTTQHGLGGSQVADVARTQGVFTSSPVDQNNGLTTLMIGTNDANFKGVGAYEQVYNLIHQAVITWLCTSSTNKYTGANFASLPANWTLDTSYGTNGLVTTTQNATSSWPLNTTGGPICVWYRVIDGNLGTFNVTVDTGAAQSVNGFTNVPIQTYLGVTDSVGVLIIQNVAPGAHTINITATSPSGASNKVSILAVGTTPDPSKPLYQGPSVFVAGVPYQNADNLSAVTAKYNQNALNNVTSLSSLGFAVRFVDVRKYMSSDPSNFFDQLHPNNTGHAQLMNAFLAYSNALVNNRQDNVTFVQVPGTYAATAYDSLLLTIVAGCTVALPVVPAGYQMVLFNYADTTGTVISCVGGTANGHTVAVNTGVRLVTIGNGVWLIV